MLKTGTKINILFITSSSELYGENRCLLNLLRGLDYRFKPIVLLPDKGLFEDKLKELGIESYRIVIPIIRRSYNPFKIISFFLLIAPSIIQMSLIIKNKNIKILHTNTSLTITGGIAAKLMGIKNVWHVREIISQEIIRKILSYFIYHLSDKIVVMSNEVKSLFFKERKGSQKIIVLYEGIDPENFSSNSNSKKIREEFGISPDEFVIGMVGRITPWKGQDDFIKAAALALKEGSNMWFFVVGDIYPKGVRQIVFKKKLKRMVKEMGISDKIIFTTFREDIPNFMVAFDIFVLPSNKPEPFGIVILEAMAMAKPVIATNIGGPLEIITHQRTGIFVPPRAPERIAQAIIELAKDDAKRYRLGDAAKEYVRKIFNIEIFQQRVREIYEGILK